MKTSTPKLLAMLACLVIAVTAHAALEVGDTAPMFEARASLDGKAFDYSLSEAVSDGAVVVYFYPSAYTAGCNIQAHEFSANMDAFNDAGATVIGVSLDNIDRLNVFSADPEYCAGNLAVASDPSGEIARSFDLAVRGAVDGATDTRGDEIGHGFAERVTFIVGADGKIADTIGGVSPMENVKLTLAAVQSMTK